MQNRIIDLNQNENSFDVFNLFKYMHLIPQFVYLKYFRLHKFNS